MGVRWIIPISEHTATHPTPYHADNVHAFVTTSDGRPAGRSACEQHGINVPGARGRRTDNVPPERRCRDCADKLGLR